MYFLRVYETNEFKFKFHPCQSIFFPSHYPHYGPQFNAVLQPPVSLHLTSCCGDAFPFLPPTSHGRLQASCLSFVRFSQTCAISLFPGEFKLGSTYFCSRFALACSISLRCFSPSSDHTFVLVVPSADRTLLVVRFFKFPAKKPPTPARHRTASSILQSSTFFSDWLF